MKRIRKVFALLLVLIAYRASPVQADESFKIIVNSGITIEALDRKEIAKFFVKRTTAWDGGESVVPVDQAPDSQVREVFSEAVHGRSVAAVKSFWQKQIFSGRNVPPPELSGDAAVVEFVKRTPGAIGYVSASADTAGVRTVTLGE